MPFNVVIPSRFGSSRLPGKPLLDIAGKPMVQHVWERACESQAKQVIIATDHQGIFERAQEFGAQVVMTREDHESGTDRLQEVAQHLGFNDDEIIVNVQGDEPLIPPSVINQTAELMQASNVNMATLYEYCQSAEQVFDPNIVKVVCTEQRVQSQNMVEQALYFSRAPIPWCRDDFDPQKNSQILPSASRYKRHLGIYAYRVKLLNQFVQWPMAQLEQVEKLEQLRVLANAEMINIALACESIPPGVDTPADLEHVRALLA
jgi:3-deoxy-manno-octulosonate cytidylyltransferase (CMP-KDO synthetase)